MRLSRYFLPVLRENPSEAQIVSHRLMLRAGMIRQQAAGIYSWLPLGYRVLRRIEEIVHQEQVRAGHSPTEFTLLRYLLINADRVVSKAQILDHVWDYDFGGDAGIVETYISYLRKKIDVYEPPFTLS